MSARNGEESCPVTTTINDKPADGVAVAIEASVEGRADRQPAIAGGVVDQVYVGSLHEMAMEVVPHLVELSGGGHFIRIKFGPASSGKQRVGFRAQEVCALGRTFYHEGFRAEGPAVLHRGHRYRAGQAALAPLAAGVGCYRGVSTGKGDLYTGDTAAGAVLRYRTGNGVEDCIGVVSGRDRRAA